MGDNSLRQEFAIDCDSWGVDFDLRIFIVICLINCKKLDGLVHNLDATPLSLSLSTALTQGSSIVRNQQNN